MLHRCLLAQTGASWLKLAKTRILAKIALLIDYTDIDITILMSCLGGLVVEFCSHNLEVVGSNPIESTVFFLGFFLDWRVEGSNPGHFFPKNNCVLLQFHL